MKVIVIITILLILLPIANAYDAIITVSATLNSYKGEPLTGYGALIRFYDRVPNAQNLNLGMAQFFDHGTQERTQPFSSIQKYVTLLPGTTYYVTLEFAGLCSKVGVIYTSQAFTGNCPTNYQCPSNQGSCWGFCIPSDDGLNNAKKNSVVYSKCQLPTYNWQTTVYAICNEKASIPTSKETQKCDAPRDNQFNPVYPTTTPPGTKPVPLILGINPLIRFTA